MILKDNRAIHLRYILLLNVIAGLVPALAVKGNANDPLLHASWWSHEQHSAVFVVFAAAVIGTALVQVLLRLNLRRWWAFLLCGAFTGAFPGLFYLAAATLPYSMLIAVVSMQIVGTFWGAIVGLAIYWVVGKGVKGTGR